MPNVDALAPDNIATAIGDLIALKPTSITVRRGASTLPAQTVRLETLASQRVMQTEGGVTHLIDAMALGYKGHPTIADTDLRPGDRFAAGGVAYEAVIVMPAHTDNLQVYLKIRA